MSLNIDLDHINSILKTLLSDHRYDHSLRVSHEACLLAKHYHVDMDKVSLAGLIHDAAKEIDVFNSHLAFTDDHIVIYKNYPAVGHAFVLDVVIPAYFGSLPDDVIQAAMWHTSGKENMTDSEKIIFIADFIEPQRPYPQRLEVSKLAYESLDKAVFEIASFKLHHLLNDRKSIYSKLVDCYNFYNYIK